MRLNHLRSLAVSVTSPRRGEVKSGRVYLIGTCSITLLGGMAARALLTRIVDDEEMANR